MLEVDMMTVKLFYGMEKVLFLLRAVEVKVVAVRIAAGRLNSLGRKYELILTN